MFKKEYKKLFKIYKHNLLNISKNKKTTQPFHATLEYFITSLKFLRDYSILTEPYETLSNNVQVVSLCVAINEYEEYLSCINKYYKNNGKVLERRDIFANADEIAKQYAEEKLYHLSRFWSAVNTNMENWKNIYDCTI